MKIDKCTIEEVTLGEGEDAIHLVVTRGNGKDAVMLMPVWATLISPSEVKSGSLVEVSISMSPADWMRIAVAVAEITGVKIFNVCADCGPFRGMHRCGGPEVPRLPLVEE